MNCRLNARAAPHQSRSGGRSWLHEAVTSAGDRNTSDRFGIAIDRQPRHQDPKRSKIPDSLIPLGELLEFKIIFGILIFNKFYRIA